MSISDLEVHHAVGNARRNHGRVVEDAEGTWGQQRKAPKKTVAIAVIGRFAAFFPHQSHGMAYRDFIS